MILKKYTVQSCCGQPSIIFKINQPLNKKHIEGLIKLNFIEHQHFTKAGILYVDNEQFIITGPLGSDRLQIKCKYKDCDENKINQLQELLQQLS